MENSINDILTDAPMSDFALNDVLIVLISYTVPELCFFSTKIQDVGCCHLNLCYARKFWCRMTSYAYTSYLAQIFLTVPEIVGCHSHSIYAKILHHPRKLSGDPYLVTKFHGHPICRFEIIANLSFGRFCLKMPYAPNVVFWEFYPEMVAKSLRPQKGHPCLILRRLSHQTRKSVDGSDL